MTISFLPFALLLLLGHVGLYFALTRLDPFGLSDRRWKQRLLDRQDEILTRLEQLRNPEASRGGRAEALVVDCEDPPASPSRGVRIITSLLLIFLLAASLYAIVIGVHGVSSTFATF